MKIEQHKFNKNEFIPAKPLFWQFNIIFSKSLKTSKLGISAYLHVSAIDWKTFLIGKIIYIIQYEVKCTRRSPLMGSYFDEFWGKSDKYPLWDNSKKRYGWTYKKFGLKIILMLNWLDLLKKIWGSMSQVLRYFIVNMTLSRKK